MSRIEKKALKEAVAARRSEYEAALRRLVEIPSVSMLPEEHGKDLAACSETAIAMLREAGAKDARLVPTSGLPVVVGTLEAGPDAPTVTVYNHLDVQPANREAEGWKHEPFRLTVEGDRFYGRGATDDKGPALTALFAAKLASDLGIRLNVQFLWENEEEIGSPSFVEALDKAGLRKTDSVLVVDTIWVSADRPSLDVGLRGLAAALLHLETGTKDAHSGLTGGAARNPITELCDVVARCVNAKTGEVLVPGFYDDVRPLSAAEERGFAEAAFSVEAFKAAHGFKSLRSNDPKDLCLRVWARPTFEVHGIRGGYQGEGVKTIVPPRAELKVSMRLVPDQDPEKIVALLAKHVRSINPDVVVEPEGRLGPYRCDPEDPFHHAAAHAIEEATGKKAALIREGGSIGSVITMNEKLGVPIVLLGLSLPEHGYHAPNECFDWGQASTGMELFVRYFEALAEIKD